MKRPTDRNVAIGGKCSNYTVYPPYKIEGSINLLTFQCGISTFLTILVLGLVEYRGYSVKKILNWPISQSNLSTRQTQSTP